MTIIGSPFLMEDFTIEYLPITIELSLLTAWLFMSFFQIAWNQFSKSWNLLKYHRAAQAEKQKWEDHFRQLSDELER